MSSIYKTIGTGEIRLLTLKPGRFADPIKCFLRTTTQEDKTPYEALSYAWGDLHDTRTIVCSNAEIRITVNLFAALRHLRFQDRERTLWVDALCINQSDDDEKSVQVRSMAKTFGDAEKVLIWLGTMTDQTAIIFPIIEQALHIVNNGPPGDLESFFARSSVYMTADSLESPSFDWNPYAHLLSLPWFRRKWVIQEVVHARKAILHLGFQVLPWESLARFNAICNTFIAPPIDIDIDGHLFYNSDDNIRLIDAFRGNLNGSWGGSSTVELLLTSKTFDCSDPRDHLVAIVSLANDMSDSETASLLDYTLTTEHMYFRLAKWTIEKSGKLHILSHTTDRSRPSMLCVPSWVPDWTRIGPNGRLTPSDRGHYKATKDTRAEPRFDEASGSVWLKGKFVDRIFIRGRTMEEVSLDVPDVPDRRILIEQRWLIECQNITFHKGSIPTPQRYETFWRALICDMDSSGMKPGEDFLKSCKEWDQLLKTHCSGNQISLASEKVLQAVELALFPSAVDRRFCSTQGGRVGEFPLLCEVGDVICVLCGGNVPYIIRPCGDGRYTFVAEAYVYGLMEGEALEMDDIEEQEICLC